MSTFSNKRKRSGSTEDRPTKRRKLGCSTYQNVGLDVKPKDQHLELYVLPCTISRPVDTNANDRSKAERNAQDSPLLRPPQELRDMIWEYVFEEELIGTAIPKFFTEPPKLYTSSVNVQVSQTCRQIHSETALLPFRRSFIITTAEEMDRLACAIPQITAPHRAHITKLEILAKMSWNSNDQKYLLEVTKSLASLLPNLKLIRVSPIDSADIDGHELEQRMVEVLRLLVEALRANFAEVKIELKSFVGPISEKTREAIFGLEVE